MPTQTLVAQGDTGIYHLAAEWDAYWVDPRSRVAEAVQPGAPLKIGSYRVDTLQALNKEPDILEMSDLKPLLMTDETASVEEAAPYPQALVTPETPFGLYFEVYHLAFRPDDQTHYTVEYEMTRRAGGGLFRKDKTDRISARTDYTGNSRTAKESILLDLKAWEGNGQLDVVVRVTDRVTGRQVERVLPFTLVER